MKTMKPIVDVEAAMKRTESGFALGPLDLRIDPGEVVGIIGPDGTGKTTLLRMLWGFVRPDAGQVSIFGHTPHLEQLALRFRAGYVAERHAFDERMTGRRFLEFVSAFYPTWSWSHAEFLAESFDVDTTEKIASLPRASRKKLAIVAALTHRPELLILDEPDSGLDPDTRVDILRRLRKVADDEGASTVLSTRVSSAIDGIADSVLELHEGLLIERVTT